jgi:hypothetical protein
MGVEIIVAMPESIYLPEDDINDTPVSEAVR